MNLIDKVKSNINNVKQIAIILGALVAGIMVFISQLEDSKKTEEKSE